MQSTNTIKETELNEETVRLLSKAKNEPDWLLQRRLDALRQFEKLPVLQLMYGLHVSAPANINLAELSPEKCVTRHEHSESDGVIIEDLSVAATKYESIFKHAVANNPGFQNKIEAMHAAFWNHGVFVYAKKSEAGVTENAASKIRLQLRQRQTEIVHVVVIAEENTNLSITEALVPDENERSHDIKQYRVEFDEVFAATGAKVKFATMQKLPQNTNSMISRKATAEKDTSVDWADISIGGGSTKQETASCLNGEGASSTIRMAFFGDETQQLDIMAKAVHNARNTTSNMRIKGALKGKAKAIVQSFTKIMKDAANSEGHQKANILLLSDTARASPIPKLEIDNYDVKASHEASVGQLDKEKLFYMMTRGLKSSEAVKLVVEGFFEPLLKEIPFEEMTEDMRKTITTKMETAGQEIMAAAEA
ncbi:SufD family Fe-S cluster assembly protein [Candidatus Woesearchaeota archaeon]|nr:SufD family Fe-S cluster assembly protein [Candidatus Woesearchaeota archaeon]